MRELTQKLSLCLLLVTALGWDIAFAQVTSRSKIGWTATKTEGITAVIPCAGTVLLSEDFESGIPAGWLVIDGDGLTPAAQMQLQPGWQGRTDYRDSTNSVAVSPSW